MVANMSVVNTMLRELAARQSNETVVPFTGAASATLTPTPAPTRRSGMLIFLVLLVLAVLIIWWRWSAQQASVLTETAQTSAPANAAAIQAATATRSAAAASSAEPTQINPATDTVNTEITAIQASKIDTAAITDANADHAQAAAPASIGWELVDAPVSDESDSVSDEHLSWPDDSSPDRHTASTPASTPDDAPITTPSPAGTAVVFERQPSTLSSAEQLAHWRSSAQRALAAADFASADRAIAAGLRIDASDAELLTLQLQRQAQIDPVAAAQRAEQLVQLWPQHWPIRQWLGSQWLQQGRTADALSLLGTATPAVPQAPDYHATLALAEQQHGDHHAASARYRQLIALQPNTGRHQAGLALSLEALADPAGAQLAWRRALLDPALPTALAQFAQQRLRSIGHSSAAQVSP